MNQKFTLEKSIEKHIKAGTITEKDCKLIRAFIGEKKSSKHITDGRAKKIGFTLIAWRKFIKVPYDQLTIADIYEGIENMKSGASDKGEPFKQNTQRDLIKIIKAFALWLNEEGVTIINEKKIKAIAAPAVDYHHNKPDDLFSLEEINRLVDNALSIRDKAFIYFLYETGARIGEIGRVTWADCKINHMTVAVTLDDQKTHKERTAFLTAAGGMKYLTEYRNSLGTVDNNEFVFTGNKGKPLSYSMVRKILVRAANRAGITKEVNPHIFRKSRITNMALEGYPEASIRDQMWGNQDTLQLRHYVKPSERDLEIAQLKAAGLPVDHLVKPKRDPVHRCGTVNKPTDKFCAGCGLPITPEGIAKADQAATEAGEMMAIIMQALSDPGKAAMIKQILGKP